MRNGVFLWLALMAFALAPVCAPAEDEWRPITLVRLKASLQTLKTGAKYTVEGKFGGDMDSSLTHENESLLKVFAMDSDDQMTMNCKVNSDVFNTLVETKPGVAVNLLVSIAHGKFGMYPLVEKVELRNVKIAVDPSKAKGNMFTLTCVNEKGVSREINNVELGIPVAIDKGYSVIINRQR